MQRLEPIGWNARFLTTGGSWWWSPISITLFNLSASAVLICCHTTLHRINFETSDLRSNTPTKKI